MLKLNKQRIEIEIDSPSKFISRLEKFKEPIDRFNAESFEGKTIVIAGYTLAENTYVVFNWTPLFDDKGKLINL